MSAEKMAERARPSSSLEVDPEEVVAALSASADDALSKADAEGYPSPEAVVEWTERALSLVLHERDRSALRAGLRWLADHLHELLEAVALPEGLAAESAVSRLLARLAEVRRALAEDVEAALEGDPAAQSFAEILAAYPSLKAIATYRLAHELYGMGVPLLPRMMTEHAHARTGIDIHPGAVIGRRFFIDHGTGVVIGETSRIGDRVRLYHGVTLGAFSPRRGRSAGGEKRHPTIGDDVTVYPGATILGGETEIGRGTVVGGNATVTESVPPESRVVPEAPRQMVRRGGSARGASPPDWEI